MSPAAMMFLVLVFCGALALSLRRLEHGLYLMVFTAPFMDVFKSSAFGVQLRANEIIPLAVFVAFLIGLAMGRARLRTPKSVQFLCVALVAGIGVSLLANLGSEVVRVEEEQGQFTLQDPTTVGIKTLVHAVACLLAFVTASSIAASPRVLRGAVRTLLISTALVCLWSLANLVGLWGGIDEFGYTAQNVWASGTETRIRGTLAEPSYFANYLGMILPLAFFGCIGPKGVLPRKWSRAVLALIGLTLMLTFSAGGWFLLAVFAVLLPLLAIQYGFRLGHGTRAMLGLALLGALVIGAVNEFVDPSYGRMFRSGVINKLTEPTGTGSGSTRIGISLVGFDFFLDHPVFGIGPNMLHFRWKERAEPYGGYISRYEAAAGSMWAFHAAELGLVGLLPIAGLFGSVLVMAAYAAARCRDATLRPILVGLLAGVLACAIHYLAHETLWWPYVWIYLGLVVGAVQAARTAGGREPARACPPSPAYAGMPVWRTR